MSVYHSDDYAGLETLKYRFYYGYEVEQAGYWCFRAWRGDEVIATMPFPELHGADDQWACRDCLLVGIGIMMDRLLPVGT